MQQTIPRRCTVIWHVWKRGEKEKETDTYKISELELTPSLKAIGDPSTSSEKLFRQNKTHKTCRNTANCDSRITVATSLYSVRHTYYLN